jgi:choline-sulfatase
MQPKNLLYIISDQHNRNMLGAYGSDMVRTPHLDVLAERGTRFANAYTNCPICVPARASLATGRYVHEIGYWDNAFPYDGAAPGWGHALKAQGFRVDSIGKLHFRGVEDDNGFTEEIEPLHVVEGVGDILGAIRDDPPRRQKRVGVLNAGPGDSTYLQYDRRNADNTCAWLAEHAGDQRPWVLFLSFVCPHPPYLSPPDLFEYYATLDLPRPPQWRFEEWPDHPALDYMRRFFHLEEPFDEAALQRLAAAYYGVCTFLDQQIGRVLTTLDSLGLTDRTRIVYTTDHGDSQGARGLFGKFTMYDESAAVPMILAGPDVPQGKVVETPVSLVDSYPTVLEAVGASFDAEAGSLPGQSLWQIARADDVDRTVFSEYHALSTEHGVFMLRDRQYKYVHYVGLRPQLFDMIGDPLECNDLAALPEFRSVVQAFERRLRSMLDPEAVDARARADQAARIEFHGGREQVIARGAFDNSPVPGEKPTFRKH